MIKIGIITGSTRPTRVSLQVAQWIERIATERKEVSFEIVDIKDFDLPLYDESIPAAFSSDYLLPEVKSWSNKIKELDGFIFITPEYNRGITSALKNALDYLNPEFHNKAAGIVSYGSSGGAVAAQQLRLVLSVPQVATVSTQPAFNLFADFKEMTTFSPEDYHIQTVQTMLDQVITWAKALKAIR